MKIVKKIGLWVAAGLLAVGTLGCLDNADPNKSAETTLETEATTGSTETTVFQTEAQTTPAETVSEESTISVTVPEQTEDSATIPTESTVAPTEKPMSEIVPTTVPIETSAPTVPVHVHSFSGATCTKPKTCSCGATEGSAKGHSWKDATCTTAKTCASCGATDGSPTGHNYTNGKCSKCGGSDPNYVSEAMVWIPTNGGQRYHSKSTCSSMINPEYVTKSEAIARGFTACGRCY